MAEARSFKGIIPCTFMERTMVIDLSEVKQNFYMPKNRNLLTADCGFLFDKKPDNTISDYK